MVKHASGGEYAGNWSNNKSIGSLKKERESGKIEWFYQKAETEERISEFNILKEGC